MKMASLIPCISLLAMVVTFVPDVMAQKKSDPYKRLRLKMVDDVVIGAGVKNRRVIRSMQITERHEFMPQKVRDQAYFDAGVPIGEGQTISSPFIVAYMTESLDPQPDDRVLEIGTGSGYQAAVLSPLVKDVYTIEIVEPLGKRAAKTLKRLKYDNVHTRIGDGFRGWAEKAPFDKIILTCSPEMVPKPLVEQLKEGGLLVVPMGERHQQTLFLMRKENGKLVSESLRPTLFVPMTGAAEERREVLPDPTNPVLLNGSFEDELNENGFVPGWYYQRQLTRREDVLAPQGEAYVEFENETVGRSAHVMQAFAIDGDKVAKLRFSAAVKCDDVKQGVNNDDLPIVALTFYGKGREALGTAFIGPFRGTRTWRNYSREIRVPKEANEAIVRIGMFGATGRTSFDNVQVMKTK